MYLSVVEGDEWDWIFMLFEGDSHKVGFGWIESNPPLVSKISEGSC